jgi:hypothetical protein
MSNIASIAAIALAYTALFLSADCCVLADLPAEAGLLAEAPQLAQNAVLVTNFVPQCAQKLMAISPKLDFSGS